MDCKSFVSTILIIALLFYPQISVAGYGCQCLRPTDSELGTVYTVVPDPVDNCGSSSVPAVQCRQASCKVQKVTYDPLDPNKVTSVSVVKRKCRWIAPPSARNRAENLDPDPLSPGSPLQNLIDLMVWSEK
ncbi:MAG: hypothetical protein KDD53_01455 [Bdellovibrionales bacterium]|nr:hypothetical protein [Bdellovibrionales bacterium]